MRFYYVEVGAQNGEAFPLVREELRGPLTRWRPAVPVINTGNPDEYTIKQLAEKTIELVNESAVRLGLPTSTSKIAYRDLPSDDPKKRKPDITLARALLNGWEPHVPLQEGLAKTIAYFRDKFCKCH